MPQAWAEGSPPEPRLKPKFMALYPGTLVMIMGNAMVPYLVLISRWLKFTGVAVTCQTHG